MKNLFNLFFLLFAFSLNANNVFDTSEYEFIKFQSDNFDIESQEGQEFFGVNCVYEISYSDTDGNFIGTPKYTWDTKSREECFDKIKKLSSEFENNECIIIHSQSGQYL